jgi:hypothetical protein
MGGRSRSLSFLGTVDLNTKISSSDISKLLEIRFVGKDSETAPGKNPIKRFKVFVERSK